MTQGPISIRPVAQAVVKEASSTRFSISILLFVATIGGAYWAGRDATRGVSEAQLETLKTLQDQRLEQVVLGLQAQAEISKAGYQEIAGEIKGLRVQAHTNAGELQVVKSMVADRR